MFFIIWGFKNREKRLGEGRFFCPHCRQDVVYQLIRIAKYFTLYWIPLFATQTLVEFVRCTNCKGEFKQSVLTMSRTQIEEANAPWKCSFCSNTNTAESQVCLGCQTPRQQPTV